MRMTQAGRQTAGPTRTRCCCSQQQQQQQE
jgi:hypothetical protein